VNVWVDSSFDKRIVLDGIDAVDQKSVFLNPENAIRMLLLFSLDLDRKSGYGNLDVERNVGKYLRLMFYLSSTFRT
jgi:hypothetical protein